MGHENAATRNRFALLKAQIGKGIVCRVVALAACNRLDVAVLAFGNGGDIDVGNGQLYVQPHGKLLLIRLILFQIGQNLFLVIQL